MTNAKTFRLLSHRLFLTFRPFVVRDALLYLSLSISLETVDQQMINGQFVIVNETISTNDYSSNSSVFVEYANRIQQTVSFFFFSFLF